MTFESDLVQALETVVPVAYADDSPIGASYPLAIYQQVGGPVTALLERALPSHKHARIQVWIWAQDRQQAKTLARQVERVLCEGALRAKAVGAFIADREPVQNLYGTRQDFRFTYLDAS